MASSSIAVGGLNGYFGQFGSSSLRDYCDSGIEYLTLAFVNQAPEWSASDYPGTNFANHCWAGFYTAPNNEVSGLLDQCIDIQGDIPYCQEQGVKVLLSIGGVYDAVSSNYEVTTDDNGEYFAEFLYSAFGPLEESWEGPRPFDTDSVIAAVDGFDFDIEADFPNGPYIAMINKFRDLDSNIIITGAPQCPTSPEYFVMADMIAAAKFDALFVQFYNNPVCDALAGNNGGALEAFNYDTWESILAASDNSKNAKIYVGLPASADAAPAGGYLTPEQLKDVVCALQDKAHFGGISLWDIERGAANVIDGKDYNTHALEALMYGCGDIPTFTTTTTSVASTTSSVESTTSSVETTTTSADSTTTSGASTTTGSSATSGSSTTTPVVVTPPSHTTPGHTTPGHSTTPGSTTSAASTTSVSSSASASTSASESECDDSPPTTASTTSKASSTSKAFTTSASLSHTIVPSHGWNSTMTSGGVPTTTKGGNGGHGITTKAPTTTSSVAMTTSTVFTTSVHTVTKCPPWVKDCPAGGYVTTETIPLYTTICPVTEHPAPTTTAPAGPWTTSTVFTTSVHTITKCPPWVQNCPVGRVTTETIPLYTTVCPVTENQPQPTGPATGPATEIPPPANEVPPTAGESSAPGEGSQPGETTAPGAGGKPAVTATTYTTLIVGPSKGIETSTVPAAGTGGVIPTQSWTGKPPAVTTTVPVAGAPALAVGLTGLIALVVAQAFAL